VAEERGTVVHGAADRRGDLDGLDLRLESLGEGTVDSLGEPVLDPVDDSHARLLLPLRRFIVSGVRAQTLIRAVRASGRVPKARPAGLVCSSGHGHEVCPQAAA
jgi:hypothetical protein